MSDYDYGEREDFNPEQEMPADLQAIYSMGRRKEQERVVGYLIQLATKIRKDVTATRSDYSMAKAFELAAENISEGKHLV
ncbi:MAG: hypothetical protein ACWGQW_24795 [bacterium]